MEHRLFRKQIFKVPNEKGAVLITGLLLILVLTILSMAAMMSTATELKIAANDRTSKRVFYVSEAGLEDARSRLQTGSSGFPIYDDQFSNPGWTAFVGTEEKSVEKGFQSGNSNQVRYDQLNPAINYVTTITHKLDGSGNILKWGDSNTDGIPEENTTVGRNIFVITSEGYDSTGASKPLRIEAAQFPEITAPAALYTKADTTIQGASTYVLGTDPCGNSPVPAIISMQDVGTNGLPTIDGANSEISGGPIEQNSPKNIDIPSMIAGFKRSVTNSYNVNSATLTGMNWGTPVEGFTQQDPLSCNERNIVYFNTNQTYVKLNAFTSGCGILMVDGDLAVHGGFYWHGVVLVTGSITFTGGGGKNVTGAMLAGGTVSADLVGGDANIVYCSSAVKNQTQYMPLVTLRWLELFS
jgi:Tfp pilus assembly protein PilX